jgi:putative SOS response-associated peptidase YedK
MCGPYRRTTSEEELARRYRIPIPPQRDLPISWNIAPTQDVFIDAATSFRYSDHNIIGKKENGVLTQLPY